MACTSIEWRDGVAYPAVENLRLENALREKTYFKVALRDRDLSAEQCQQLKVIESHGDQVLNLLTFLPTSTVISKTFNWSIATILRGLCVDHTHRRPPIACMHLELFVCIKSAVHAAGS